MYAYEQPGIADLTELAQRDGADVRPLLLRVLTDLYLQQPTPSAADRARFAELACRLLDSVEIGIRTDIAQRLAHHAGTPASVAARLARDDIRAADPILRNSPVLGEAELHAILDANGIAHAIAIAGRSDLPDSVARRLRGSVVHRARPQNLRSADFPNRDRALTRTLARRYLVAGTDERQMILTALPVCAATEYEGVLRALDAGSVQRLERAALLHHTQRFIALLEEQVGLPADIVMAMLRDPTGDPLAVLCRALDIPLHAASRMLLFLHRQNGASMRHVFALSERIERVETVAARRLLGAWRGLVPVRRSTIAGRPEGSARDPRGRDTRASERREPAERLVATRS
jgi:hypothetical protein